VVLPAQQSGSAILTFDDRLAAVTRRLGIDLAEVAP
jgi:hypothetical protein